MLTRWATALDAFWGRRDAAVTVPSMDGALRPNRLLDESPDLCAILAPDDLAVVGGDLFVSSARTVQRLAAGPERPAPALVREYPRRVTCLAGHGADRLAVGQSGGGLLIGEGPHDGRTIDSLAGQPLICPTAAVFADADTLLVCQGSTTNRPEHWKRDLMERRPSGAVWRIDLRNGQAVRLADALAYPNGICLSATGDVIVAEAWRHRLVVVSEGRPPRACLADLPAYPGRLIRGSQGYWLCFFAPRGQLIEFVLREPEFRARMLDEVPEEFWLAPTLRSGQDFREPLQGGAVKQLGQLKPWAPSLSYGLVARLDDRFRPVASFHSRADGARHGVTACAEWNGTLVAAAQGHDTLVALDMQGRHGARAR